MLRVEEMLGYRFGRVLGVDGAEDERGHASTEAAQPAGRRLEVAAVQRVAAGFQQRLDQDHRTGGGGQDAAQAAHVRQAVAFLALQVDGLLDRRPLVADRWPEPHDS